MKKLLLLSLLSSLTYFSNAMDASLSFATFKSPGQNYVEVYLHVVGNSVAFVEKADSMSQAAVEVIVLFKIDGKIHKFDKFKLNSPLSAFPIDFIDQKRYGLENGKYELEVSIQDLNKEDNAKKYNAEVDLNYNSEQLMQSDVQLLSSFKESDQQNSFTKNGFHLETLPFNFYSRRANKLIFYNEIYNSDKVINDKFLVRYVIEKVDGKGNSETIAVGNKKQDPVPVNVVLIQKDISGLVSGNYNLIVEIRNKEQVLLSSKKVFFQRSNPYLDLEKAQEAPLEEQFVNNLTKEELEYGLRAIAMNVTDNKGEILNAVLKDKDLEAMKRFLFSFWVVQNPNKPEDAYTEYMKVAKAVDNTFNSGFGHGFESDRGNIFMKYGKPSDMIREENESTAPPYEIWSYNDFPSTRQSNVKFLFYNPSLASGQYLLLHSTARGELNNPQWENILYDDANSVDEFQGGSNSNFIDGTSMGDGVYRNARRYFTDF